MRAKEKKEHISSTIENEVGQRPIEFEFIDDPFVDNVFAVRARFEIGDPWEEFMIYADGTVQSCEFWKWPPSLR